MTTPTPAEFYAALEGIRADAARASAAAQQVAAQAPGVSQGIQNIGHGATQVGAQAPGAVQGLQGVGQGIGQVGQGIGQTGTGLTNTAQSIRYATDEVARSRAAASSLARMILALALGVSAGAVVVAFAAGDSSPKHNTAPKRRKGR
jgi:methyl-accepting chemotaxis protein